MSVTMEKTWIPSQPYRRGYEATTTKEAFCLNDKLSINGYGRDIEIVRIPIEAYSPKTVHEVELTEDEINALLVWMHGLVGHVRIPDEMYQEVCNDRGMTNKFTGGFQVMNDMSAAEERALADKRQRTA